MKEEKLYSGLDRKIFFKFMAIWQALRQEDFNHIPSYSGHKRHTDYPSLNH